MARQEAAVPHPSSNVVASDLRVTREWLTLFSNIVDRLPRIGTATFPGGGPTTIAVTLAPNEADTNYLVVIEHPANRNYWITSRAVTGFTINQSATADETVRWALLRF